MKTAYKFLREGLRSDYDESPWALKVWRREAPPSQECQGLNCSRNIVDALKYVQGEILARVEYGGAVIASEEKLTCETMRIVKAWKWNKRASVQLAVFAAKEVLGIFEKEYPQDSRPRAAIAAAEAWLREPSEKNRRKAGEAAATTYAAAYAARTASVTLYVDIRATIAAAATDASARATYATRAIAATIAATDAAIAIYAAARATYAIADTSAASDAAYAARTAIAIAARKKLKQKLHRYVLSLLEELEVIG